MLCSDASPVHPVLKNLLLGADVITPMVCTDASPGSTGAEDLALARLASSLEHSTPNAPMHLFEPSVQPGPIS